MTSDLRIQGEVVVNSEQAESAFNRVGDKAQQMANEVATSANKAGQAVDKIGDGAGASAEKFTRAESRISASIKRATNELELLGKTASQRLEFNISDKGLDPKKFEPMLQRLREVEQRAREAEAAATGSLNNMGMSARATAAAMRGVPAQFQDIIVSLQGGQAPMTVLLQQGSQLSGMFGGAGNAAKALGTYIVGLVNPLTIAAAAVAGLGFAMYSLNGKDAALRELSAQLIGTGRASAAAVGDIKSLVNELNTVPGVSKAAATAIIGEFAKVSGLGSSLFKGLGSSVADFAAATGTDLPTAAKKLAEAFADPANGAKSLEDSLGTLTAAQILTITKMAEMGDKSGAQAALLDALKQATEGLAKQGMTPLGEATDKMSNAWDKLTTSVGNSSAFRTANDWLAKLIEKTAELTVQLSQMQPPTWLKFLPVVGPAIGAASLLAGPEANAGGSRSVSGTVGNMEGGATGSWGPTADDIEKQVKAALDLTRSYESQSAAMEKLRGVAKVAKDALRELEAQNRGNSVEAKELRERITGVNEKLAEMAKKGGAAKAGDPFSAERAAAKESADFYLKFTKNLEDASAATDHLTNSQKELLRYLTSPAYQYDSEAARQQNLNRAYAAVAQEQLNLATKEAAKIAADAAKGHAQYVAELAKGAQSAQNQADQLRTEEAAAAIAASGYYSLAQAIELVTIARLEEKRDGLLGNEEAYLAVQKEIDARKELVGLIGAKEARKASEDSAKDAAREWQRTADEINRSLTDALLRGFESGKGFAKNLRDTIANMFKTLVLRPIISAVINPVAGAITGALGLAGTASAATSGVSALGGIGNIASLGSNLFGSGLGSTISGAIGSGVGALFGTTAGNAALGTSLGLGAGSATAAAAAAAQAGGASAAAAASAASTGASIAGAIPYFGAAIAALSLLAGKFSGETRTGGQFGVAFDGSVTNQRRGQTYTIEGQQFDRDFTNGLQTALKDGIAYRLEGDPVAQESAIREAVAGTASGINGFLKALGSAATLTGFSAGLETSGKGRGGVFAGGLLSTGQGFGESGKGDNYAGTLFESFSTNSPDFKTALENFTLDLKQSTIQALQTVSDIPETVKKLLAQVDAEGLTEDAANKLLETINAQIVGVNQFKDALKGMGLDTLAALSFDAAAGLAEVSGGFDKLLGNLQTYYTNFFTGEEQRANLQRSLAQQLSDLGLQLPDINASNARDQFRALVSAAERDMSESGRKTYATLLALSGAFASITDAADGAAEAVKKQQDAVYSQFQRALGRDRDGLNSQASALQDTISGIADAVDTLRSNARDLYQTVDGTRNMLAAQGMVYIEQALAGVRAGASVADYSGLSDAISAARSGIDGGRYATQFERERDALVLAGQLSQLADSGELQLSFEERQLRAVNEQLEYLNTLDKRAEELVNGTTTLTGTVQSYFDQLLAILKPTEPEQGAAAQPGGAFAGVGGGGGGGVMGTPVDQDALLKARIDQQLRFGEEKGLAFNDPAVLASINAALYGSGATNADIARLFDIPKEDVDALFKGAGIARFDIGTNYVPRDMLAYIHEGEAVVPKAYNPAANPGAGGGSNADLAAAVNRLAEQNAILAARLEAIEKNTQLMPQMGRQFNDVTNGGTVLRSKAIA